MASNIQSCVDVRERGEKKELFGLTVRSLVLGLVSMVLVGLHAIYADFTSDFARLEVEIAPAQGGLLMVIVLLLSNAIMKSRKFEPREIITVYVCHLISGAVYLQGVVGFSVVNIAALGLLSMQQPDQYIPIFEKFSSLVALKDTTAVLEFWVGNQGRVPWAHWVGPIMVWTAFWCVVFFLFICMVTIVRYYWVDRERLSFPLAIPVIELVVQKEEASRSVWRSKHVLWGLVISFIFYTSRFISFHFPVIPALPDRLNLADYFIEKPWSVMSEWPGFQILLYPGWIGVGYLVSLEISFSLWFSFLLLHKVIPVILEATRGNAGLFAYDIRFSVGRGVFLGVMIYQLWLMRGELKEILLTAINPQRVGKRSDGDEPLSYRTAVFGGVAAFIVLSLFSVYMLNMRFIAYLLFIVMFLIVCLGFARLRAEAGYMHAQPGAEWLAQDVDRFLGTPQLPDYTGYSVGVYFNPMYSGWFGVVFSNILESYKLADDTNMKRRSMTAVLLVVFVVTLITGYIFILPIIYKNGMFNLNYHYVHMGSRVSRARAVIQEPAYWGIGKRYIYGLIPGILCFFLRTKFLWWPFHPLGLAIAPNSFMTFVWGPFFIAWLIKLIVFRYGGAGVVKNLQPFFISLILGSAVFNGIYALINWIIVLFQ